MTDYANLEATARDFVRKFAGTAGEDVETITRALGQGASQLQDAMRQYVIN
jgi:ADP-ribosylation factor GTPase-activating protein 2/3